MLGIEDYGSDAESGDETTQTTPKTTTTTPTTPTTASSKLPPPKSKSTFALPPPKSSSPSAPSLSSSSTDTATTTSSAPTKQKRVKKIAINLPDLPPLDAEDEDERPPAKKPRVASTSSGTTGAGKSALLSMLPAPKQLVPVIQKKNERVLGGGAGPGLVFRSSRSEAVGDVVGAYGPRGDGEDGVEGEADTAVNPPASSTSFLPPSLKKGKANISLDINEAPSRLPTQPAAPAIDFFSLGSNTSSTRSMPTSSSNTASVTTTTTTAPSTSTSSVSVSSAPSIPTFRPPSPTLDDPHPGYYQLPSGAYAPYDAEYYASYAKKWKAEYEKHIRELEKSQYNPETEGAQDVDMAAEMEKARREVKEREDRKALTSGNLGKKDDGEPEMPRMNVKGAKLGSVARSRHQLTTLLTEAYLNREALEERIAAGRRNRKEAGLKYGF